MYQRHIRRMIARPVCSCTLSQRDSVSSSQHQVRWDADLTVSLWTWFWILLLYHTREPSVYFLVQQRHSSLQLAHSSGIGGEWAALEILNRWGWIKKMQCQHWGYKRSVFPEWFYWGIYLPRLIGGQNKEILVENRGGLFSPEARNYFQTTCKWRPEECWWGQNATKSWLPWYFSSYRLRLEKGYQFWVGNFWRFWERSLGRTGFEKETFFGNIISYLNDLILITKFWPGPHLALRYW